MELSSVGVIKRDNVTLFKMNSTNEGIVRIVSKESSDGNRMKGDKKLLFKN